MFLIYNYTPLYWKLINVPAQTSYIRCMLRDLRLHIYEINITLYLLGYIVNEDALRCYTNK